MGSSNIYRPLQQICEGLKVTCTSVTCNGDTMSSCQAFRCRCEEARSEIRWGLWRARAAAGSAAGH